MKVRKKPVIVDAYHLKDLSYHSTIEVSKFIDQPVQMTNDGIIIKTLEGDHLAKAGDYIIKGVHGEFYPCKPDIFKKTYEVLEDDHSM